VFPVTVVVEMVEPPPLYSIVKSINGQCGGNTKLNPYEKCVLANSSVNDSPEIAPVTESDKPVLSQPTSSPTVSSVCVPSRINQCFSRYTPFFFVPRFIILSANPYVELEPAVISGVSDGIVLSINL